VTSDGKGRADRSAWEQNFIAFIACNQSVHCFAGLMFYYNHTQQHYGFIVYREEAVDYDQVFVPSDYVYM
jgi:hypothetical protein